MGLAPAILPSTRCALEGSGLQVSWAAASPAPPALPRELAASSCQPRSSASFGCLLFPLVSLITTRVWRPLLLYLLIHLSPQVLPTMSLMPPPPLISLHGPLPGHPPPAFLSASARVILLPCSLMGSASSTNTHPGFHGNQ